MTEVPEVKSRENMERQNKKTAAANPAQRRQKAQAPEMEPDKGCTHWQYCASQCRNAREKVSPGRSKTEDRGLPFHPARFKTNVHILGKSATYCIPPKLPLYNIRHRFILYSGARKAHRSSFAKFSPNAKAVRQRRRQGADILTCCESENANG
jgi:hypothetical protein